MHSHAYVLGMMDNATSETTILIRRISSFLRTLWWCAYPAPSYRCLALELLYRLLWYVRRSCSLCELGAEATSHVI